MENNVHYCTLSATWVVNTYNTIGDTYKWMNGEDSDTALCLL